MKHCTNCNKPITSNYGNLFCSRSCSASHNNKKRKPIVVKKKKLPCSSCNNLFDVDSRCSRYTCTKCLSYKKLKSNISTKRKTVKKPKSNISTCRKTGRKYVNKSVYQNTDKSIFCKLFINTCSHCEKKFVFKRAKKYCKDHEALYSRRYKYDFNFNIYDYPDLFDLDELNRVGFFCAGGRHSSKNNNVNPNGFSRDHKVSINEAIKNNYDPYYIGHVMNCDLIPHSENNKKNSNSSITYEELIVLVDEYDSRK